MWDEAHHKKKKAVKRRLKKRRFIKLSLKEKPSQKKEKANKRPFFKGTAKKKSEAQFPCFENKKLGALHPTLPSLEGVE